MNIHTYVRQQDQHENLFVVQYRQIIIFYCFQKQIKIILSLIVFNFSIR